MQMLTFELVGKMAHFRKYYANNTAMSFSIPPRTTLMGMLAAILGMPRDSYYDALSSQRLRLTVGVQTPLKKSFHRLNFLKVEAGRDLDGSRGHIQLPFEVVTGYDLTRDFVRYRVYVAPATLDQVMFDQLVTRLTEGSGPHFALSLGTANFSATLENICLYPQLQAASSEEILEFHSAVPSERVKRLAEPVWGEPAVLLDEELMPADFLSNQNRELVAMNRVLFSTNGHPLRAQVSGEYFELVGTNEIQRLVFME
ncbi:CRISPR-associated protein Cas5 [Hymenobacter arizonensis]|uniref:CRISPR-associated protein, Cas5h family n=1 Tax=Hymenobacter arizonensis TaxID=1227077 RepID=A0A1I6BH94_HYMAR|nr:CRISPR-associated protein Cas5 [Hymenobacter arizonensis]SFQ80157.1 CRISPR-associated protein, Cas5h family [Hymenobacter arizonensis]